MTCNYSRMFGDSTLRPFKFLSNFLRPLSSAFALGLYSLAALPCLAEPLIILSDTENRAAQISPDVPAVPSDSEAPATAQDSSGSTAAPTSESDTAPIKVEEIPAVESNTATVCPVVAPIAAADSAAPAPETVTALTGPVIPVPDEAASEPVTPLTAPVVPDDLSASPADASGKVTALTAPVVPVGQSALQQSVSKPTAQTAAKIPPLITRPIIIAVPSTPLRRTTKSQGTLPEPPPAGKNSVQLVGPPPAVTVATSTTSTAATGPTDETPQTRYLPIPETNAAASDQASSQSTSDQAQSDIKVAMLCPPVQNAQTPPATNDETESPKAPSKKEIFKAIDHTRRSLRNLRPF